MFKISDEKIDAKNSIATFKISVKADEVKSRYPNVFDRLRKKLKIKGFRKGQAPDNIILKEVGELAVHEEASNEVIQDAYIKILTDKKLPALGYPRINILKMSPSDDLEFTIEIDIMPEIKVSEASLKKVAKKVLKDADKEIKADKKEIDDVVKNLLRTYQQRQLIKEKGEDVKISDIKDKDLPELTDEVAKEVAGKTKDELLKEIEEAIVSEKRQKLNDEKSRELVEALDKVFDFEPPKAVVEGELQTKLRELKRRIEFMGLKYDDYLKSTNKTDEDIVKDFTDMARKTSKMKFILNAISEKMDIKAPEKEVKEYFESLKKRYGDMKDFSPERAKQYAHEAVLNTHVVEYLKGLAK